MDGVTPEFILNWDQTSIKIAPTDTWTRKVHESKCIKLIDLRD